MKKVSFTNVLFLVAVAVCYLFLFADLSWAQVRSGNQEDCYEGVTVAATPVPKNFTFKSYEIFIRNTGANELYVKLGQVDITAAMIDTPANRSTNKIWVIPAGEGPIILKVNHTGMSWMTTTGETTTYEIHVLESGAI